ncbi:uncharacterized protein [Eurosta solidaginis]|uniref:uncharacterized protein n=1 Tax=Eurosta solidaginis TaxID=178769 RepID=UPI00353166F8
MHISIKLSVTTIRLIAILQELTILNAIIVEHNLYSYYKLPGKPEQVPREFHILQFPYHNTTDTPTLSNMENYSIVNSNQKNYTNTQITKSALNTSVKYQVPTKSRGMSDRLTKIVSLCPYIIVRSDFVSKCFYANDVWKNPSPTVENLSVVEKNNESRNLESRTPLQNQKPLKKNVQATDKHVLAKIVPITQNKNGEVVCDGTSTVEEQMESAEAKSMNIDDENFAGHNTKSVEYAASADKRMPIKSVLKYLGSEKPIKRYNKKYFKSQPLRTSGEKYYDEQTNYQRGEKLHGFQNYYHRDEIYNDFIFYDDLQQNGHYVNRSRQLDNVQV